MPMGLKCIIGKWLHKGQITQEEYDAVIKKLAGHDKQIRAEVMSGIIALCDDYRANGHNLDVEKYLREQLKGAEE